MIFMKLDRHKRAFFGANVFTGSMPLLNPSHSLKTCGGPEACTFTKFIKKCGGKTNSGGQERYLHRTYYELPYPTDNNAMNPAISPRDKRKYPTIQRLTTLPKLNPYTSRSGSYTGIHPLTKIYEFTHSFHFIT